jgi:transmembrane serine protease 11B
MYYYQGGFQISGVTYKDSCENAASPATTDLSKDIKTKVNLRFLLLIPL